MAKACELEIERLRMGETEWSVKLVIFYLFYHEALKNAKEYLGKCGKKN